MKNYMFYNNSMLINICYINSMSCDLLTANQYQFGLWWIQHFLKIELSSVYIFAFNLSISSKLAQCSVKTQYLQQVRLKHSKKKKRGAPRLSSAVKQFSVGLESPCHMTCQLLIFFSFLFFLFNYTHKIDYFYISSHNNLPGQHVRVKSLCGNHC